MAKRAAGRATPVRENLRESLRVAALASGSARDDGSIAARGMRPPTSVDRADISVPGPSCSSDVPCSPNWNHSVAHG